MTAVFAFAAIVGWPFLLFFVFFGGEDGDVVDADLDLDTDLDSDLEISDSFGGGIAAAVLSLLSFRSSRNLKLSICRWVMNSRRLSGGSFAIPNKRSGRAGARNPGDRGLKTLW